MTTILSLACWYGLCDRCDDLACDCPDDRRSAPEQPLCPGCGIPHDLPLHYDGVGATP